MATVAHTIRSHYDPKQREVLERETGQITNSDVQDSWQSEYSLLPIDNRRSTHAPRFVPASTARDSWNQAEASTSTTPSAEDSDTVAGWYRSLNRSAPTSGVSTPTSVHPSTASSTDKQTLPELSKRQWFIKKALRDEPTLETRSNSSSSLADILARDPPALPNESPYKPPVFLTLGPSNVGFKMLQQSGWSEGEALGPGVVRRREEDDLDDIKVARTTKKVKKEPVTEGTLLHERRIDDEISEVRKSEVIDLTLSSDDNESEDELENVIQTFPSRSAPVATLSTVDGSAYAGKALLTPLPTVLKSDRLGIGLKAKTIGPYRASQKRITHNMATLAQHERNAEEMRRRKKEFGRGHKALARENKKATREQRDLLAYMNE